MFPKLVSQRGLFDMEVSDNGIDVLHTVIRTFQNNHGTILHLPATASLPNFLSYHSLLIDAVTARLVATKMSAVNMVLLDTAPGGAPMIAMEK